ncbi:MAG: hypothetical protein A2289_05245 [Deltaproteobacteria bacterium RIFOXYA12_FULL_58_15]|nr:MAG: hypothetical protein A2289_05245 [Deltaproteobacteria bacterium RIFOXYA12_FULL_58_15]OGR13103.1 MAG: hypothetical protein A2341_08490 [Deltaproteobacteria bacterium RIFOXYB12_FULL_58_9]
MRRNLLLITLGVSLIAACGGGRKGSKGAQAAEGSGKAGEANQTFGESSDGKPGWIMRGNVAMVMADGRRVFYAVGAASGIKNVSLLRSTADNRGRNELVKLFEVFSASLMKDYMSASSGSGEEQVVENAIKTATSASLKGSEIVDRYADGDGTLYALAALDLKVLKDVLAAEAAGAAKSYVTKVDVDDIFDRHGKKPAPPPPPPRVAADDVRPGVETESKGKPDSNVRQRTGEKPAWIDGEDANFSYAVFLCGVGFGGDRTAAENGSYAALARIFIAHVASMSQDFMGAYSKTGAQPVEVQSSETLTKVATGKVFSGVQLMEVWAGGGTTYALSCMERAKASRILREQIAELDDKAGGYIQKARSADKVFKVSFLGKALDAILEREALNSELRIVDVDGVGVSGPYSHSDVAAAFESAVDELKVGVEVSGPFEEEFQVAFIKALTERGFKVTDMASADPGDQDVLLDVIVKVEDGGKGTGSTKDLHFADATVIVQVKAVAAGKVVGAVEEHKHRGHRNLDEAKRGAVRALATQVLKKVGAKIDEAMTGR